MKLGIYRGSITCLTLSLWMCSSPLLVWAQQSSNEIRGIKFFGKAESPIFSEITGSLKAISNLTQGKERPASYISVFVGGGAVTDSRISLSYLEGFPLEIAENYRALEFQSHECTVKVLKRSSERVEITIVADTDHVHDAELQTCILFGIARSLGAEGGELQALSNREIIKRIVGKI